MCNNPAVISCCRAFWVISQGHQSTSTSHWVSVTDSQIRVILQDCT